MTALRNAGSRNRLVTPLEDGPVAPASHGSASPKSIS
jgi:hypothetical protein